MNPRVTISVLTYCALEHAKRCIASIQENVSNYELILTANGSPEAAAYFRSLADANPRSIRVVVNETNEGFISPNRHALTLANGEYFLLCNDDCLFQPGLFAVMEQPFWLDARCGLTAPAGGCHSLQPDFHGYLGNEIHYLEGACLMGRTSVLRKIGLFSDYLSGSYCEDADLSLRMVQAGYTLHEVTPPKPFEHIRGATSNHVPGVHEMAAKNRAVCVEKWGALLALRANPRKILIRRDAAYGDVLLLSPVIRAIKRSFGGWPIFVESKCFEVFQGNPDVAGPGTVGDMPEALVIELNNSYERQPEKHILQCYTEDAERSLGVPLAVSKADMFLACDPHELAVERSVFASGKWVAIHAGPSWPSKSWDAWSWLKLINQLMQDGWNVVLVGHAVQGVFAGLPCTKDRRGKTSISRLAAVLSCCKLAVVIDSFVLHAAAARGVPTVALFGCTRAANIVTASNVVAVESDPAHPVSGLRHRVKNSVSLAESGEVMETILIADVLKAVHSFGL